MSEFKYKAVFTNIADNSIDIDDEISVTVSLGSELKNNNATIKLKNDPINVFNDGTIQHKWVDKNRVAVFQAVKATRGDVIDEEQIDFYVKYEETDPTLGIKENSYFYFVHSYYVEPKDDEIILAKTDYGKEFVSGIAKDNIFAVQFHPERSGEIGLKVLKNFTQLKWGYLRNFKASKCASTKSST